MSHRGRLRGRFLGFFGITADRDGKNALGLRSVFYPRASRVSRHATLFAVLLQRRISDVARLRQRSGQRKIGQNQEMGKEPTSGGESFEGHSPLFAFLFNRIAYLDRPPSQTVHNPISQLFSDRVHHQIALIRFSV
ncbi:hypothetical protein L596_011565 [Steinernema carpocapsae]|uniref:Uncharacterized protein n=1 Tax=Steinernema carpocapsae TaxID=34508 RepID=A0A4U5NUQ3_STECR|nr:hypothetical protein L596_011565 [Steinernema carpocapsae]